MITVFTEPFLLIALGVGLLTAVMCAYVGNFVLMKGMTFIAIALSEIAALGVALGFVFHLLPDAAALAAELAGVIYFWRHSRAGKGQTDGVIGFIYATAAAVVLLIISKNPRLEAHGIDLISGNLLYSTLPDLVVIALVALVIAVLHLLFRREFLFVSFDRETARTLGLKSGGFDLLLMLTFGVVIAFSMKLTGMLFVFASLIVPGLAALSVARRVHRVFLASVVFAAAAVVIGLTASFHFDLPSSPTIICVYALCFLGARAWQIFGRLLAA